MVSSSTLTRFPRAPRRRSSQISAVARVICCATSWLISSSATLACAQHGDTSPSQSLAAQQSDPTRSRAEIGINGRYPCTITHVADGDSVTCNPLGRVRLLLIDAPELSDGEIGRQARAKLLEMMPLGTEVIAETDVRARDQFGRVLAYLYLPDGQMVNERMAESGYVTTLVYPPNVKNVERIRSAVARARNAKRGLWATGGFDCAPVDYRAGRCR
jgi:micrococcal nuclease